MPSCSSAAGALKTTFKISLASRDCFPLLSNLSFISETNANIPRVVGHFLKLGVWNTAHESTHCNPCEPKSGDLAFTNGLKHGRDSFCQTHPSLQSTVHASQSSLDGASCIEQLNLRTEGLAVTHWLSQAARPSPTSRNQHPGSDVWKLRTEQYMKHAPFQLGDLFE